MKHGNIYRKFYYEDCVSVLNQKGLHSCVILEPVKLDLRLGFLKIFMIF